jgi:uncharacterized protein YjiS (DUF1127 family)
MAWLFASVAPLARLAIVNRPVGGLFRQIARLLMAVEHRREVRHVAELDDRILKDIGLSRRDVESALLEPMFRDPSVLLVQSAERRDRIPATPSGRKTVRPTVSVAPDPRA